MNHCLFINLFIKKTSWGLTFIILFIMNIMSNTTLQNGRVNFERPAKIQLSENLSKQLTISYNNFFATFLWFQTTAYYGSHLDTANYDYLSHQFNTITTLNPRFKSAYYMAATVLPWNTGSTKLSSPLVLKAMVKFPNDWRWPYYRAFNTYWFEHNYQQAGHYFELSATKPNAPPLVSSLAARMRAETNNIDTAINFLARLLHNKNDSNTHTALLRQYKQLQTEKQLQQIEQWLKALHQQFNLKSIQYLKKHGYAVPSKLADGGHIIFKNDGTLVSSKSKKRFQIFIPPKRQGVLQHEPAH